MSLKSLGIAVLLTVMAVTAVVAMEQANGDLTYSWRYKMTVEVETPEGIKTGSAVRDVNIHWKVIGWNEISQQPHYSEKIKIDGEAVVVDLGKRGKLFALIDWTAYTDPINAFNVQKYAEVENIPVGNKAKFDVSKYPGGPTMVTFTDFNDPKTVSVLLDWEKDEKGDFILTEDHMEKLLGEGVYLKNIKIEISDDPIEWKVRNYLPWLDDYHDKLFDGQTIHTIESINPIANRFGAGSFTTRRIEK